MTGHSKRKHSEYSPSSAKRWMNCPGSIRLSRGAPSQIETVYAKEGTLAHECLEFVVKRFKNIKSEAGVLKWPKQMVHHAINSAEILFSLKPSRSAELLVETKTVIKDVSKSIWGTLDYAWVDLWGDLIVIDFKYGAGIKVRAIEEDEPNPQLMLYALGVAEKYNYDFERIKLGVIQPRVGGEPLDLAEIKVKELKQFKEKVREALWASKEPDAPLISGPHCRFCPAATTCPENSEKALKKANVVFDFEKGLQAAPAPFGLNAEKLGVVLQACNQLEHWIRAVKEHAFNLAERGEAIPGFKLAPKRPQRVWTAGAETEAVKRFGVLAYETEKRFLSPAKLEQKLGVRGRSFVESYTAFVSSGNNLVEIKDPRNSEISALPFDF